MFDRPMRVLVADNEPAFVEAISLRFEGEGYRTCRASSGAQAAALLVRDQIDLVVTDLNMPGGGGMALIHTVRDQSNIPVIVVTGYRKNHIAEIEGLGDVTVFEKPCDAISLVETASRLMHACTYRPRVAHGKRNDHLKQQEPPDDCPQNSDRRR